MENNFKIVLASSLPHQQRVIIEANELGVKIVALKTFIDSNPIFEKLEMDEKQRLHLQYNLMKSYFEVLEKRILNFENLIPSEQLAVGLSFGQAIEAAKQGKKVARTGWNGSGMFAYIVPANSYPAQTGAAKSYFGEGGMVPYREYWALKTAQDDVATWAPSGSDSLAEDWCIVE